MKQPARSYSSGARVGVVMLIALVLWVLSSGEEESRPPKEQVAFTSPPASSPLQPPSAPPPNEFSQAKIDAVIRRIQLEAPLPIRLNAGQYQLSYEQNELRADADYKGKSLRVDGIVSSAVRNIDGDPVLLLLGHTGHAAVAAYMAKKEEPDVASLNPGQSVTLRCEGAGRIARTPALGPCYLYRGELPNEIQAAEAAAWNERAAQTKLGTSAQNLGASPQPAASEPTE